MTARAIFHTTTGTGVQALADLSRLAIEGAPGPLGEALAGIGDPTGETWLHLMGLCLEIDRPARLSPLIDHISAMDPFRFRRVLLGATAWSWRSIVGGAAIEAAAAGDPAAARTLLSDDRYYAGVAATALPEILPLGPEATQERFVNALLVYRETVDLAAVPEALAEAASTAGHIATEHGWIEAIVRVCGFHYMPEPEARRVVLMPHVAGSGLTLAQHDDARLIVYGVGPPPASLQHVTDLGSALADETRVRILSALGDRTMHLGDLVEITGLTRSTVHHHLRVLRGAELVAVEGNARAYRYRINPAGRRSAVAALSRLLHVPDEGGTRP